MGKLLSRRYVILFCKCGPVRVALLVYRFEILIVKEFYVRRLFFVVLFFSAQSYAGDCVYSEVVGLQAQSGNVLVQVRASKKGDEYDYVPWKNLGGHDSKAIKSYQSIAQQAIATGSKIMLRFASDVNCYDTDYATVPIAFRLYEFGT